MSYGYSDSGTPYGVPNSSNAIVSLIAGILGLTLLPTIGSIVALVTGYMAKKEIKAGGGAVGGEGLATGGIILGWIGVGISVIGICVVGAILLVPLCLIPLGISIDQYNYLIWLLAL